MRPSDRSDVERRNDEYVEAIATAMLADTAHEVAAWEHAGIVCANHLIDFHPSRVESELAEAEAEWNTPGRIGRRWLSLIGAYRDALREYVERGTD